MLSVIIWATFTVIAFVLFAVCLIVSFAHDPFVIIMAGVMMIWCGISCVYTLDARYEYSVQQALEDRYYHATCYVDDKGTDGPFYQMECQVETKNERDMVLVRDTVYVKYDSDANTFMILKGEK